MNDYDRVKRIQAYRAAKYTWEEIRILLSEYDSRPWVTAEQVRSWYRRRKLTDEQRHVEVPRLSSLPPLLSLPMRPTLVFADIHVPYHHSTLLQEALDRWPCQQIVVAGDFFTFDRLSAYPYDHETHSLEHELHAAKTVLQLLASYAPVYLTSGNHDRRFVHRLGQPMTFRRLIHAALEGEACRVDVTERDYLYIGTSVCVGHLRSYSRIPGKLATKSATYHQRHVLVGHDHLLGGMLDTTKRWFGASIGTMARIDELWYAERALRTLPPMQNGYAYIVDEHHLYVCDHTHTPITGIRPQWGSLYVVQRVDV